MNDNQLVGPNVPIVQHNDIAIPPRIWKKFLMGTYSWMISSILYMLLNIASAIYYLFEVDGNSRIILAVSYAVTIMAIYWLSANVRDLYRFQVLRTDAHLNEQIRRNLGGPNDCTRTVRTILAVAGTIVAFVIFVLGIVEVNVDKVTGCIVELQMVAATAVLTKTFQDREDAKFLSSFNLGYGQNGV
jgi:hypothetical protein